MRFTVLLPLALSIVAVVLGFFALFAGHTEGYMEDYAIVRLNTSTLGHNVLFGGDDPSPTSTTAPAPTETDGGFFDGLGDDIRDKWKNLTDEVGDKIDDIANDIADKLAKELGIAQWYSLHLMDSCEGTFAPNATSPGAWFNVTNCTDMAPGNRINLTEILDHELSVGPLNVNLNDLKWPSGIQKSIDKLNSLLLAIFIFYVIGICFSGLAIFGCTAAFFMSYKRLITITNFAFANLAALCFFVGSIITTIGSKEAADAISDFGQDVGVSASQGQKFTTISWIAFAMMAAATLYWAIDFCLERRSRKREYTEKKTRGSH